MSLNRHDHGHEASHEALLSLPPKSANSARQLADDDSVPDDGDRCDREVLRLRSAHLAQAATPSPLPATGYWSAMGANAMARLGYR